MNKITMTPESFNKYLYNSDNKLIDSTVDGEIFKCSDDKIIKVLDKPIKEKKVFPIESVGNDSFVFPKDAIYINKKIEALTYDYLPGLNLNKYAPNYGDNENIDTIIIAIKKLIDDILKLSDEKILAEDVRWANIVWNKNYFKIIGTLNYKKSILDKNLIAILNLRDIIDSIYNWLISENLYMFLLKKGMYEELIDTSKLVCADQVIYNIKMFLENYFDCPIDTFGQAESKLLKRKR